MRHEVLLTAGAERDLQELHHHVAHFDSPEAADRLLDALLDLIENLSHHPARGSHPRELLALGMREFRQLLFKPYRIIYRAIDGKVFIYLIADGRREFSTLLARRLLGG